MVPAAILRLGSLWRRMVGELVGAVPAPAKGGGGAGRVREVLGGKHDGLIGCPRMLCAAMNYVLCAGAG